MTGPIFWTRHQESESKTGLLRETTVRPHSDGWLYLAALLMLCTGKNLKSRIEKLERQAALVSTRQLLPPDGMLDISDYDYMPSNLAVPGLVTRSNGFASYSASPVEVPTLALSGLCVDPKTPDSSAFLSTTSFLGIVCLPPLDTSFLFTLHLRRKRT
jgi:hypothetical protein